MVRIVVRTPLMASAWAISRFVLAAKGFHFRLASEAIGTVHCYDVWGGSLTHPELEKIARTLGQFRFPKKITIEVTAECNLDCVMCHQPTMLRAKGVMPFELWRKCADEIVAESSETECWFSGSGEPLLQPDLLCEMISYGKSVGLKSLNLNTNGMLMSAELANRILETDLDVVVFGVDGYSSSTYEKIRVGGDREELYENIENFLTIRSNRTDGPDVQVQFIEMDENKLELNDFKRYWLAKGAVVKFRRKLSWGGRIETPTVIPEEMRIPCPWAISLMHVLWDGRVARCAGDTEGDDCVGSAWEDSLYELWGRLGTYRQLHLERRFGEIPEMCRHCKDWMTGASERIRPPEKYAGIPGRLQGPRSEEV